MRGWILTHLVRLLVTCEDPTSARRCLDEARAALASELFLSVNTVKTHTRGIFRKLGVTDRAQAVSRARELGLL